MSVCYVMYGYAIRYAFVYYICCVLVYPTCYIFVCYTCYASVSMSVDPDSDPEPPALGPLLSALHSCLPHVPPSFTTRFWKVCVSSSPGQHAYRRFWFRCCPFSSLAMPLHPSHRSVYPILELSCFCLGSLRALPGDTGLFTCWRLQETSADAFLVPPWASEVCVSVF